MNKEEVIKYLKEHPEDILDICRVFSLHVNFHDKDEVKKVHEQLKELVAHFKKLSEEDYNKWHERYWTVKGELEDFEKRYHLFEPEFDLDKEVRWIPKEYNDQAEEIFEFRKEMYRTDNIYIDYLLNNIIREDEGTTWSEKGGQDGMYDAFPFTVSYKSEVDKHDYENPYYDPEKGRDIKVYHYRTEMIRSYCLDSCGGLALIETITYTSYDDNPKEYPHSRFQLLTLGEDDGNHFLNGARIYEDIYGGTDVDLIDMLNMLIKEYKSFKGIQ